MIMLPENTAPFSEMVYTEEIAAVAGMDFDHGEGQAVQDVTENIFHNSTTAPGKGVTRWVAPSRSLQPLAMSTRWRVWMVSPEALTPQ